MPWKAPVEAPKREAQRQQGERRQQGARQRPTQELGLRSDMTTFEDASLNEEAAAAQHRRIQSHGEASHRSNQQSRQRTAARMKHRSSGSK